MTGNHASLAEQPRELDSEARVAGSHPQRAVGSRLIEDLVDGESFMRACASKRSAASKDVDIDDYHALCSGYSSSSLKPLLKGDPNLFWIREGDGPTAAMIESDLSHYMVLDPLATIRRFYRKAPYAGKGIKNFSSQVQEELKGDSRRVIDGGSWEKCETYSAKAKTALADILGDVESRHEVSFCAESPKVAGKSYLLRTRPDVVGELDASRLKSVDLKFMAAINLSPWKLWNTFDYDLQAAIGKYVMACNGYESSASLLVCPKDDTSLPRIVDLSDRTIRFGMKKLSKCLCRIGPVLDAGPPIHVSVIRVDDGSSSGYEDLDGDEVERVYKEMCMVSGVDAEADTAAPEEVKNFLDWIGNAGAGS